MTSADARNEAGIRGFSERVLRGETLKAVALLPHKKCTAKVGLDAQTFKVPSIGSVTTAHLTMDNFAASRIRVMQLNASSSHRLGYFNLKEPGRIAENVAQEIRGVLPGPAAYMAIAARTLGLCITAELLAAKLTLAIGLLMIYISTSHTSRVPVPIVFPFSS
jgi:hypothetical protein